nr:response regulator transcription factor [Geminicoccus flavidas]
MHRLANAQAFQARPMPPEQPHRLGRVLVVDDDPRLRSRITRCFADHRYLALGSSGGDAARHLQHGPFSLVVLDVSPAAFDGLDLLRRIRACSDVPVILITGQGEGAIDRVVGLELGADDFLCAPLDLRELLARARAILRRQQAGRRSAAAPLKGGYRFAGWELHHRSRVLKDPAGAAVGLTRKEFALLLAFLEAPGRPLSRAHLMRATRMHEDVFDRSIDIQVLRLRRKIETDPAAPRLIRTERGLGYLLDARVELLF